MNSVGIEYVSSVQKGGGGRGGGGGGGSLTLDKKFIFF